MSYLLQYGDYVFPDTFYPADLGIANRVPGEGLPLADGGRSLTGWLDKRRVIIRGGLAKDTVALLTKLDALRAAIYGARPGTLYMGDNTRYLRLCEAEALHLPFTPTGYDHVLDGIEIPFVTADPFFYSTTVNTDTWTVSATAQTHTITTAGNAYCRANFKITVGGSGAETIAFTVTNQTTGEAFTLAGDVTAADVIEVDCLAHTVKIGAVDKIALFDGVWPRLAVGVNSMLEAYTASSITQIATVWQDRYF